jgi:hypothetical protein
MDGVAAAPNGGFNQVQGQLPLPLPCYDFTESELENVTELRHPSLGGLCQRAPRREPWPPRSRVGSTIRSHHPKLQSYDGRCVQDPGTDSPERADLRLLTIPSSRSQVSANNTNFGAVKDSLGLSPLPLTGGAIVTHG